MDLSTLVNEIDDITDPSAMEKVLMYLDYIQAQDEEFIELLLKKLPDMEVTWLQPWYQESKTLTRAMPYNPKIEDNFRTDKISKDESDRIHKNWRKFTKRFDIPDTPERFARWKNTTKCRSPQTPEECVRRFVTAFLARGLKRTLHQVYNYISTHYGTSNRGQYSLEEEKVMEVCFYHNAKNAIPILTKVLGRNPRGIYKKLHEWINGPVESKKIKWTLPIASKFLTLLIEYTGRPLNDLKNARIEKSVWLKLEKDMDQRYMYLQKFWINKLHVQVFVKKDIKLNKLRKKIVQKIQNSSYKVWTDIQWKELAKQFPDGFTGAFLYRVLACLVNKHRGYLKMPIEDLIKYVLQRIPSYRNRRLRTLAFDNEGQLKEVRYEKVPY